MRLVQEDQTVDAEQAGMDRLHAIRYAVSAEQQSGTNLIDSGAKDRRLRRRSRPIVLQRRSASKPAGDQRRRIFARQPLQPTGNFTDNLGRLRLGGQSAAERIGYLFGTPEGIVHHETPVDNQRNPQRSAFRHFGAQRQMEHGRIQSSGLSRPGRQVQHIGPFVAFGKKVDQSLLPRKRSVVATMDGAEKIGKMRRA